MSEAEQSQLKKLVSVAVDSVTFSVKVKKVDLFMNEGYCDSVKLLVFSP